jgi:hypothetical protein
MDAAPMKVNLYADPGWLQGSDRPILDVKSGLERHGLEVNVLPNENSAQPCDLAVVWGVRNSANMRSGKRCLVIERGYIGNRFYWASAGFDGLNGRADFCNADKATDTSRFKKNFEHLMLPWRETDGKYVLVIGQVPGDQALINANIRANRWYDTVCRHLIDDGHEVVFRPHPCAPRMLYEPFVRVSKAPLEEDLANAEWVATINSNTAVDALMAGTLATACDMGSMVWDVASRSPVHLPERPDRAKWANKIAWCQWSPEELANGDFWDHLKIGMEMLTWQAVAV